jgi:hypothetical protein
VLHAWQRELEAARYAAQRAPRQYDATDPENRLVADELERRWNQALQRVDEIEQRIAEHRQGEPQGATPPTREQFDHLAADLEVVWNRPHADGRRKKRIVRTLIQEVVVDVDPEAGKSSSSFIGRVVCIPSCDCRAAAAVRLAATPLLRSWRRCAPWRRSVRMICWPMRSIGAAC